MDRRSPLGATWETGASLSVGGLAMSDSTPSSSQIPQRILAQPVVCAECGLQVDRSQITDECELCGAPRCRRCADAAGPTRMTPYICSACAADD